jgi:hypothetical protein
VTLDLPQETAPAVQPAGAAPDWKDWDAIRGERPGPKSADASPAPKAVELAAPRPATTSGIPRRSGTTDLRRRDPAGPRFVRNTQEILARYRQKAGLTEKDPLPFVGRPVPPRPLLARPPILIALLVLVAGATAGITLLVFPGRKDGDSASPTGVPGPDPSNGSSGAHRFPVPAPRELRSFVCLVGEKEPLYRESPGAGCLTLSPSPRRIPIWVLLDRASLDQIEKLRSDPRRKIAIAGEGILYSARDSHVENFVPAGFKAQWVLQPGGGSVDLDHSYQDYLDAPDLFK